MFLCECLGVCAYCSACEPASMAGEWMGTLTIELYICSQLIRLCNPRHSHAMLPSQSKASPDFGQLCSDSHQQLKATSLPQQLIQPLPTVAWNIGETCPQIREVQRCCRQCRRNDVVDDVEDPTMCWLLAHGACPLFAKDIRTEHDGCVDIPRNCT